MLPYQTKVSRLLHSHLLWIFENTYIERGLPQQVYCTEVIKILTACKAKRPQVPGI